MMTRNCSHFRFHFRFHLWTAALFFWAMPCHAVVTERGRPHFSGLGRHAAALRPIRAAGVAQLK